MGAGHCDFKCLTDLRFVLDARAGGDGDGDGGGGSSFFGTPRKGKRVVYLVDFSLSMESDVTGGGTRIDALKKQ
jgi:hypothetical protein